MTRIKTWVLGWTLEGPVFVALVFAVLSLGFSAVFAIWRSKLFQEWEEFPPIILILLLLALVFMLLSAVSNWRYWNCLVNAGDARCVVFGLRRTRSPQSEVLELRTLVRRSIDLHAAATTSLIVALSVAWISSGFARMEWLALLPAVLFAVLYTVMPAVSWYQLNIAKNADKPVGGL